MKYVLLLRIRMGLIHYAGNYIYGVVNNSDQNKNIDFNCFQILVHPF